MNGQPTLCGTTEPQFATHQFGALPHADEPQSAVGPSLGIVGRRPFAMILDFEFKAVGDARQADADLG
jgi:hypothetical protein